MKLRKIACLALLALVGAASAVVFPVGPFPPSPPAANNFENFDAIPPGSYVSFPAMNGFAAFARIGGANALVVDNGIMPGLSAPNSMWGRGCDVEFRYNGLRRRFGGFMRQVPVGPNPNGVLVQFYQGAVLVGAAVAPIAIGGGPWVPGMWRGWFSTVPFNRVLIIGLGGTLPGYVAMDNVRVRV